MKKKKELCEKLKLRKCLIFVVGNKKYILGFHVT